MYPIMIGASSFISDLISRIPFGGILLSVAFLAYWMYTFLVIYHLTRFGIGAAPKVFALIFFVGSGVLFMLAVGLFGRIHAGDISAFFRVLLHGSLFEFPSL